MQVKTVTLQFKRDLLRIWNIYIWHKTYHSIECKYWHTRLVFKQDCTPSVLVIILNYTKWALSQSILIYGCYQATIIRKMFILYWNIINLAFRLYSTNYNTMKLHRKQLVKIMNQYLYFRICHCILGSIHLL